MIFRTPRHARLDTGEPTVEPSSSPNSPSDAAPRRYLVRSPAASTALTCTPAVAERIRPLMEPYLTLTDGTPEPGTWHMLAGVEPPAGAVRESVAAHGEVPVHYAVDHAARAFHHLAPEGDAWAGQSLLRAVRAEQRCAASRRGALFVHAGLVELGGTVVALAGGSRAGKTSFIMAAVLSGAGRMVCNDDVSLTLSDDGTRITGTGWPRSVSVRLDTLDLLFGRERAAAVVESLTHPANETLPSLRASGAEPHGTALLYPWEYAELLGTTIGRSADVDALVHLSLADDPAEAGLTDVPPAERAALLDRHVLALPNKHLNIFGHEPEPGRVQGTRDALAALPTHRFRYAFRDVRKAVEELSGALAG